MDGDARKEITLSKLVNTINICKEAVDKSHFGPLFVYTGDNPLTDKQINQAAWGVFTILFTSAARELSQQIPYE